METFILCMQRIITILVQFGFLCHYCGLVDIFHMTYAGFLSSSILDTSLYHMLYLVRSWYHFTIAQRSFRFRDFNNLLLPSHMLCVCNLLVHWTWVPLSSLLSSPFTSHSPSLWGLLNRYFVYILFCSYPLPFK